MNNIISQNVLRQYQSKYATREVIGCLIKDPSLLKNHNLLIEDFVESFHKVVFVGINNVYNNSIVKIDGNIIEEYLKEAFPTKYMIFKRNNGALYIDKVSEICELDNFEANYIELKKYSLLRRFLKEGFDVSDFFDPEETNPDEIDKKRELFEESTINDIIDFYKNKILGVSGDYNLKNGRDSIKAGGLEAKIQKEKWKDAPGYGLSYASQYFNTVTKGIRKKRLVIGSADSGVGKTRLSVANLCFSFVPRFYNSKTQKWEKNPHGTQNIGLYIGTEMELLEEIEPILWAYIADVPEEHILYNKYEPGEEERVDKAIDILGNEANIYLEYVPDYDVGTLEKIIDEHVTKHKVSHVFFDYIHTTTDLISEFQAEAKAKMQVREDQILHNLGVKLKELTRKYNISIDTWTQVSLDIKNEQNRDSSVIRGAKGLKDKADVMFIATRPTIKEYKLLEKILKSPKCLGKKEPNLCYSIYKNRGGKLNNVKIWMYVDYDTMRVHDCFITDYEYKLLMSPKTYIGLNEDMKIETAEDQEELQKKLINYKIDSEIKDDGIIIDIDEEMSIEDINTENINTENVNTEEINSNKEIDKEETNESKDFLDNYEY